MRTLLPRPFFTWRTFIALLSLLSIAAGLTGSVQGQQRHVLLLEVDGIINPISEGFIARGIERAEKEGAEMVIIRLDTPGGMLDSTRKITQHLLEADVPSAVYVAPRGARAASAGTFITAAANFAVMAPSTNIGAASPISGSGEDLPDTLKSKAFQDAAAEMRGIADARGRNAGQLEATVLEALSFTSEEALAENMIDFIASDVDDLLQQVHGLETPLRPPGGPRVTLDTQGITVQTMELSLVERLLRFLANPNISFLLLSLGGLGLFVELLNPGLILPGVTGIILLVLAWVVLGNLPVNWAGAILILLAFGLALLEYYVAGFGVLGVGAIVCLLLGGLLLFFHTGVPSPTAPPSISVSLWVLIPTVLVLGFGGGLVIRFAYQSRHGPPDPEVVDLIGQVVETTSDLNPRGTVRARGETWTAVLEGRGSLSEGQQVRIVAVDGIMLTVAPIENTTEPPSPEE